MTTLEIIGLIVGITLLAGFLGYIFSNGKESSPQIGTFSEYTPEELLNIKAAEKAYKDVLRLGSLLSPAYFYHYLL